eukprot:7832667-Pyramimonas_sp.AAC.1
MCCTKSEWLGGLVHLPGIDCKTPALHGHVADVVGGHPTGRRYTGFLGLSRCSSASRAGTSASACPPPPLLPYSSLCASSEYVSAYDIIAPTCACVTTNMLQRMG